MGLYPGAGCGTELRSYVLKQDPRWPFEAAALAARDTGVCGKNTTGECHQLVRGKGHGEGCGCDTARFDASVLKQPCK